MPANPPLTKPEVSSGTNLADQPPPKLAGNYADDDGLAIDQYFEAADQGPETFDGLRVPQDEIPSLTRLVGAHYYWIYPGQVTANAVRILAPDVRRKHIYLSYMGTADGISLVLDSDPFAYDPAASVVQGAFYYNPILANHSTIMFAKGTSTPQNYTLDDHTGALWMLPIGLIEQSSGSLHVAVTSVTY